MQSLKETARKPLHLGRFAPTLVLGKTHPNGRPRGLEGRRKHTPNPGHGGILVLVYDAFALAYHA
eukprot:11178352-Lingulodinium_polyedra.AAC.1